MNSMCLSDKISREEGIEILTNSIIRIINLAVTIEKIPIDIGHGVKLSASEFHIIDTAGKSPNANLSTIASFLGVTKGAISQMVQKLVEKGFLKKIQQEGNRKNIILSLTKKGEEALLFHKGLHQHINDKFISSLIDISPDKIYELNEVLKKYEIMMAESMVIREEHIRCFREQILDKDNSEINGQ